MSIKKQGTGAPEGPSRGPSKGPLVEEKAKMTKISIFLVVVSCLIDIEGLNQLSRNLSDVKV